MDNHGVYVTFDVPRGHRLFGTYISIERSGIPAGAAVEFVPGAVGPQLAVLQTANTVTQEEPVKTSTEVPMASPRSVKIQRLEEELEKVKANLIRPPTPVVGDGCCSPRRSARTPVLFHWQLVENPPVVPSQAERRRRFHPPVLVAV